MENKGQNIIWAIIAMGAFLLGIAIGILVTLQETGNLTQPTTEGIEKTEEATGTVEGITETTKETAEFSCEDVNFISFIIGQTKDDSLRIVAYYADGNVNLRGSKREEKYTGFSDKSKKLLEQSYIFAKENNGRIIGEENIEKSPYYVDKGEMIMEDWNFMIYYKDEELTVSGVEYESCPEFIKKLYYSMEADMRGE